jgi:hypothetical protein
MILNGLDSQSGVSKISAVQGEITNHTDQEIDNETMDCGYCDRLNGLVLDICSGFWKLVNFIFRDFFVSLFSLTAYASIQGVPLSMHGKVL